MDGLDKLTSPCDNMENWFGDIGKTILQSALGDVCDQINDRFKAGINSPLLVDPVGLFLLLTTGKRRFSINYQR